MQNSIIDFKISKKKCKFDIMHNLDEIGLSIGDAFICWNVRTDDFSIESFCEYVKSKDSEIICVPRKEYNKTRKK